MSDLKTNLQEILQEKQDKIIPEEYTTAVNTTEQILVEEETVNE